MKISPGARVVLCALAVSYAFAPQAPAPLAAAFQQVDALAAAAYAKDPVGGLTVGIVSGPALAWTKSYGFADAENRRAPSADTVYRIGSITKQFTATMLLQLVERGTVRLTEPVEKYLPEIAAIPRWRADVAPVTLLQLATMTSGLAREPGCAGHTEGPVSRWEQKVLDCLSQTRFVNEPGTEYLYSNIGYAALGLALARAAKQPYTAYVREHILLPLGMTRTAFEPDDWIRANVARGYTRDDGPPVWSVAARELEGRGYRVPNGALLTTVGDLAKFVAFELGAGPPILKKATQDETYARLSSATWALGSGYGIGFQATRRGTLVALGHGGSTAGFLSAAQFDRASKIGVVVLRNADGGRDRLNPGALALGALEIVAAAAGPKPGTAQ